MNSFSRISAAIVDFPKKGKKTIAKSPFQNPSQMAVPALTVSAEKY